MAWILMRQKTEVNYYFLLVTTGGDSKITLGRMRVLKKNFVKSAEVRKTDCQSTECLS
jgi:hypothetical protein